MSRQNPPPARNDSSMVLLENQAESKEPSVVQAGEQTPVKVQKEIVYAPVAGKRVDETTVNFKYYNSFNYSLLSTDKSNLQLTLGITSANPGEGKTLVASNLALSLTLGFGRKAVVVDLNIHRPRLHEVFGVPVGPGLIDALQNGFVHVSWTQVENLAVLPSGTWRTRHAAGDHGGSLPPIGLEHMASFGEVIRSLEQSFDFVVVDMPSINSRNFPILFANQLDGLIVVIDAEKTKKEDIEKMFQQVNEQQVLGFVFNRVRDGKA